MPGWRSPDWMNPGRATRPSTGGRISPSTGGGRRSSWWPPASRRSRTSPAWAGSARGAARLAVVGEAGGLADAGQLREGGLDRVLPDRLGGRLGRGGQLGLRRRGGRGSGRLGGGRRGGLGRAGRGRRGRE